MGTRSRVIEFRCACRVSNFVQTSRDHRNYAEHRHHFFTEKITMFTVEQYRARAIEYSQLLKIANDPNEVHEYQRLQRSFTELADNAQWAADNHDKTVHATKRASAWVTPAPSAQGVAQQ